MENSQGEGAESKAPATAEAASPVVIRPADQLRTLAAEVVELKATVRSLLEPADVHITGQRAFYKKSFFRKVAAHYNISAEKIDEAHEQIEGDVVYYATYRASDPEGRTATGDGTCSFGELAGKNQPRTHHMARSVAHTRAFNRSVSNLKTAGMVSAEEASISAAVQTARTEGAPTTGAGFGNGDEDKPITEKMLKMLYAVTNAKKVAPESLKALVQEVVPDLPTREKDGEAWPDLTKLTRGPWRAIMRRLDPNFR